MREASARFKDQLGGPVQWLTKIEWSNTGKEPWNDAGFVSGDVTRSLIDQVHWKCNLTLAEVPLGFEGLNSLNTRLRIKHGIKYAPGDHELLAFGTYRVMNAQKSVSSSLVTLTGESYESFIRAARTERPIRFRAASADALIRAVVRHVFGDKHIEWDPRVAHKRNTPMPDFILHGSRWQFIDGDGSDKSKSIADAIGVRVITDSWGGLRVIPVPTLQDDPVGEFKKGTLLVDSNTKFTNEGVANIVYATGASTDGSKVVGPVVVRDIDPRSPTYWERPITEGGFGHATSLLTNPLIRNERQLIEAAQARLAQSVGLRQQVSIDSAHNPLNEPGDVYLHDRERVLFDALTYNLLGGQLKGTTRVQARTLDGLPWDVRSTEGSE